LGGAISDGLAGKPFGHRRLVELDEKALTELVDGRQPIGRQAQRRPAHGEPDIFEIIVGGKRCRLEAGEAVKARHFAQPMHDSEVPDGAQQRIVIPIPCVPRQRLGIKQRARRVVANRRIAACEDVELGQLWRQRCILITAAPELLEPGENILVGVPFERGPQSRIEASPLPDVRRALRGIEITVSVVRVFEATGQLN